MWNSSRTVAAPPAEILHVLTHEDAIRRWSPVDFELLDHRSSRLHAGDVARVEGRVAGMGVGFDVEVTAADSESLALIASGPVDIDVRYEIERAGDGSAVEATVDVRGGRGMTGRVVATTVRALLAAGALDGALGRIAEAVEHDSAPQAQAAGELALA
jgi:uncharacterized protein YndB with AHSA1/START domain